MKVNEPNLGPSLEKAGGLTSTAASKAGRVAPSAGGNVAAQGDGADGVQLSGLAKQLQSLDPGSPERDARVEQIARAYADGSYKVDAEATASGVIDDALRYSKNS